MWVWTTQVASPEGSVQALCMSHKVPGESTQMSSEPLGPVLLRLYLKGFFQIQVKEVKMDGWKMPDPCYTNDFMRPAAGCLPSRANLASRAEGSEGLALTVHPTGVTQTLRGPCIDVGAPTGATALPCWFRGQSPRATVPCLHRVSTSLPSLPSPPRPCRSSTGFLSGSGQQRGGAGGAVLVNSAKILPKCLFHTGNGPGAATAAEETGPFCLVVVEMSYHSASLCHRRLPSAATVRWKGSQGENLLARIFNDALN